MVRLSTFVFSMLSLGAATSLLAQDLAHYRDFALGSTTAAVTARSGVSPADLKVVHQRPAVIQDLRWRPQHYGGGAPADPVREVLFRFYDDKLFLVGVDYDRQRIEGLTDADVVTAMTAVYGPPLLTSTSLAADAIPVETASDVVVARWADGDTSVTLSRGTYPMSLRLLVVQDSVERLARSATAEAILKDREEAPQREADRQKQITADRRVAADKARGVNKPAFRP